MAESTKLVEPVKQEIPRRGGELARRVIGPQRQKIFFPEETRHHDDEVIAQLEEQLREMPTEGSSLEEPVVEEIAKPTDEKYSPKHAGAGKHRRPNPLGVVLRNSLHIARATQDRLLRRDKHIQQFRHEPTQPIGTPDEPFTPIQASGEPLPKREPITLPKSGDTLMGSTNNTETVLVRRVGRGNNADIYQTEGNLAVKVFKFPDESGSLGGGATPEEEAAMQASVDHPHIATVHAVDSPGERYIPYMVMDLALGGNLKDRIEREPIPVEEGLLILTQTAQALLAIHDAGLVHRDFKPHNVLLTDKGVKVTDFGIATKQGAPITDRDGYFLGTLKYMAPERFTRGNEIAQSDMYSWGMLAAEVLTGKPPYEIPAGSTSREAMNIHLNEQPRAFADLLGDRMTPLHAELEYIIARTLAKNPEDRYPDFAVLLDHLNIVRNLAAREQFSGDTNISESVDQQATSGGEEETIKASEKQGKQSWGDLVRGLRNRFLRQSSPDDSLVSLDDLLDSTDTTKR
jgi:serine/threonine protein kinase